MNTLVELMLSSVTNYYLLLTAIFLSFLCKFFILFTVIRYSFKTQANRRLLFLLILFLIGTLLNDACFGGGLLIRKICSIKGDIPNFTLLNRIDWIFFITQYQAFAFFLYNLVQRSSGPLIMRFIHILINIGISSCFMYFAIAKYGVDSASRETLPYELGLIEASYVYLAFLFIPLFILIIAKMRSQTLPRILTYQLRTLILFFSGYLVLEGACNHYSLLSTLIPCFAACKYACFTLTTLFCSCAVYYGSKKIMGLRFLNIRPTIESKEKFDFLTNFKDILDELSYATALQELAHLTQTFFHTAFALPLSRARLYIRNTANQQSADAEITAIPTRVEYFLSKKEHEHIVAYINAKKILMRDELEFTSFYENDQTLRTLVDFLHTINADIFLPIYERNVITAYIIVEQQARPHALFTDKERDEMLVFTSYLSNIITILKYSNIESFHQKYTALSQELHQKHQEIQQYRESIRSFIRTSKERKIGIIFYKHRRFSFANEEAQELIGFDLNNAVGHGLSIACKNVARRVYEYKTSQSQYARDSKNNKVIIAGIPSLDDSTVILLVYYPEISDILRAQFDRLKDPSTWDYVLYLETTHSGQLVNQLIPGMGENILHYKITLLATALSKKATLLELPEEDIEDTVEILHQISLRKILHEIPLSSPEQNDDVARILFGMNPLLQKDAQDGLLKKLDTVGTLFIRNIEYLGPDTQKQLAEFLATGYFKQYKSDHKISSNVRIICSTTKDLHALSSQGAFSKDLLKELEKASVAMPPLHSLEEKEIQEIAQGYAEQIGIDPTYKKLLTFTEKENKKLIAERPLSLHELKESVHSLLLEKSEKHNLRETTEFDPAYNISEPDIAHAVRLGKKALKDPQLMTILWNKFENQNKIATLLGVNRSSVNRRCQEYNLK